MQPIHDLMYYNSHYSYVSGQNGGITTPFTIGPRNRFYFLHTTSITLVQYSKVASITT